MKLKRKPPIKVVTEGFTGELQINTNGTIDTEEVTTKSPNIQGAGSGQNDIVSGQVQPETLADVLKWVTDNTDDVVSSGWVANVKPLNDSDRSVIQKAIKGKTGAKIVDLSQQLNDEIKVWKKEEAKVLNQKRTAARKSKGIVEIDYDPIHTGKVTEEAAMAIVNDTTPGRDKVFRYGNGLVSIQVDHPTTVRGISQLNDKNSMYPKMPVVKEYNTISLKHRLEKSAEYVCKDDENGNTSKPWTNDIVDGLFGLTSVVFPPLTGIIQHPFVDLNGKLFAKQGYDEETGLYVKYGTSINSILIEKPKQKDVKAALDVLCNKVLADFPFAEEIDKISAVAVLLTAIQRKMITGDSGCPGFLFDAPVPGTGKTTLAEAVSYSIFGRPVAVSSWCDKDTEMAKLLLAIMLEGHSCVLFDNLPVGSTITSNELAKAMTGNSYSGRVLGRNKTATVPSNALLLFTGNNISICGDFNTRIIPIRLDSRCADPDRRPFTRTDIGRWCLNHRAEIIKACLILVLADYSQLPKDFKPTRYPDWDRYVRLPLLAATGIDIADKFQQNKQADPEIEIQLSFLTAMFKEFGGKSVISNQIIQVAAVSNSNIHVCMADRFPAGSPSAAELGRWLGGFKNQILGGYRLTSSKGTKGDAKNRTVWMVQKVNP
jgi:putative DNA primase/helicase